MTPDQASWPRAAAALAGLSPRLRLLAALLIGLAWALAQPPLGLWPVAILTGPLLFWLWASARGASTFWTGWAFGVGYFGLGLHWIVEPFLVDAATWGWAAPIALLAVSTGLALFPAVGFRLAAYPRDGIGLSPWPVFVIGWAALEFTRSYILTGFPWALPAYIWVDDPPAQLASVVGPYGLTALTIALATAPGAFSRWKFAPAALAAVVLVGAYGWGVARLADAPINATDTAKVRIVQPNIPQDVKWDIARTREHFNILLDLSRAGDAPADIIIWPESAVTFPLDMAPLALDEIVSAAGGADVAIGSLRVSGGPEAAETPPVRWRNSLFLVGSNGALSDPFDKIHLVPFGEYLPFNDLFRGLGISAIASLGGGIVPGEAYSLMTPASAPTFAPLICYEMIFPREVMEASEGADWLVLVTNDAWFGSWWGPGQHLAQAQMRAIETGRPIARSANTGVSAMISPLGAIVNRIEMGRRGQIEARLHAPLRTEYTAYGEWLTALILALLTIASFARKLS